ncbi:hypothetical protein GBA52_018489 [Prunus armeniaca]|nr:hypothetical protein GBA52_018489 [Prunus armeniaca]
MAAADFGAVTILFVLIACHLAASAGVNSGFSANLMHRDSPNSPFSSKSFNQQSFWTQTLHETSILSKQRTSKT